MTPLARSICLMLLLANGHAIAAGDRLSWAPLEYLSQGFRTAPWVRDPFYPQEEALKLSGVVSNEIAYINGKWVRAGEMVDGYIVKFIGPKSVTLMKDSRVVTLNLGN